MIQYNSKTKSHTQYDYINFIFITAYILFLSLFTINKHRNYCSFAWDLGIFNQAFWTTTKEMSIFRNTCELFLVKSGSFFGVHFSPVLYSLIPFYTISKNPETLLIAQSIILGIAALPLYLFTKERVDEKTGLVASLIYLSNPMIHGINTYDFHVQCFIPLLVFSQFYYASKRKWKHFLSVSFFSFMIEEHLFYVLMAICGVMFIWPDKLNVFRREKKKVIRKYLLPILVFGVYWIMLSGQFIQFYNPDISPLLRAGRHFRILGVDDPLKIPYQIIMNPLSALGAIKYSIPQKGWYLLQFFGPLLFLSFLSPILTAPALVWLTLSLLSNYEPYYSVGFQYPAYGLPIIFVSSVQGLKKALIRWKNARFHGNLLKLFFIVNFMYFFIVSPISPVQTNFDYIPAYMKPHRETHSRIVRDSLARIPTDSSIITQDNIFPHLSSREDAYVIPPMYDMEINVWKDLVEELLNVNPSYIVVDESTDPHDHFSQLLISIQKKSYHLIEATDGVRVFRYYPIKDNDYPDFVSIRNETSAEEDCGYS